jgi:undecaprenyl-diphosphatase
MLDSLLFIFLQIVSESFPISSSGHVELALCLGNFFGMFPLLSSSFFLSRTGMFLLHIPTLIIVAFFFRVTWWTLLHHLYRYRYLIGRLIGYAFIADSITALCYVLLHCFHFSMPLSVGFAVTGGLLFSLRWTSKSTTVVQPWHMIMLGIAQGIALLPGISRLGVTYSMGRWLGLRSPKSFAVAWMIGWPLMTGGALIGMKDISPADGGCSIPLALTITGATLLATGGFALMYRCAARGVVWKVSYYMLIPFVVALLIGC